MHVKLISYSQPVGESMTLTEMVAFCARVSNPANQNNTATSSKLIRYLQEHKHWSPFEMVSICVEIETTRDISRQILRHRSFSFQEFSQRYAVTDALTASGSDALVASSSTATVREARLQDKTNRQSSLSADSDTALCEEWRERQERIAADAAATYKWALDHGIAKEQARVVLPEGMTPTRMYMHGTLRSWLHYFQVRTDPGTQKEHREIAEAIQALFTAELGINI